MANNALGSSLPDGVGYLPGDAWNAGSIADNDAALPKDERSDREDATA